MICGCSHLHGIPVFGVILDLLYFNIDVGILLLELAYHIIGFNEIIQVVVLDGKSNGSA